MVIPNPHTCPARMSRCTLQKLPANAVQFAPNRRPVSATSDVPQDTLTAQIADLTRVGRFPTLKSFTKPTTQTEKTRPSLGRVSSATATAISNIRMLEPQAQKQTTHRAACRKRGDRTSIGPPSGNLWQDASLAPSCEDDVNVVPGPSRGSPREA
jgi:hypothetical protein